MDAILNNRKLGYGLIVGGLAAVNLVYLGDLIGGEATIWLGSKSAIAIVIANIAVLLGVCIVIRLNAEEDAS